MQHIFSKYPLLICALWLSGCATTIATQLPEIANADLDQEQITQEELALETFLDQREQLTRVSNKVLLANSTLCPKTSYEIGVRTHSLKSYPKSLRERAKENLGLTETSQISYIRPGSPADKAGVKIGDIILGKGGVSYGASDKAFQSSLRQAALTNGVQKVTFKRGTKFISAPIKPQPICDYKIKLSNSTAINAFANGNTITVTSGMLNFVKSDDELALLVGHELGHNTMGHIRKIISNFVLTGFNTKYTRPFESEADYVGMYYLNRAGYSDDNVEDFWRRLSTINPKSITRAKTHPTFPDRYLRIAATRAEISRKKAAGEDLAPNFISGDYFSAPPATLKDTP